MMHPPQGSSFVATKLPALVPKRAVQQVATECYEQVNNNDDESYDEVVRFAANVCGTSAAMLSFIHHGRQWLTASIGIASQDCPRALFFCAQAMHEPDHVVVVPDLAEGQPAARNWREASSMPFHLYAAAPLMAPLGTPFGMISLIDSSRRRLTESQASALRSLARQIARQLILGQENAALRLANTKLAELSMTDALTCIANRRAFDERMASEEARARRTGEPFSLLLMDVDKFKSFNDRHGHLAGDEALVRIAETLKSNNRLSDLLARYGGEEFALILPHTRAKAAAAVAERLRSAIEALEMPRECITFSIGVGTFDAKLGTGALIAAADRALYAAKAVGRNRVVVAADEDVWNS
jgi:diguanylate cyclase (GGDEF)-like protein